MALKIDQEYLLLAIDKNDGSKSFINLALTTSFYFRVILDLLDSFLNCSWVSGLALCNLLLSSLSGFSLKGFSVLNLSISEFTINLL